MKEAANWAGRHTMKRFRKALFFILLAAAFVAAVAAPVYWVLVRSPYPTAEAALEAFYGGEPRPECMQAQPLLRHGPGVVPLIIRDLPNKAMPRRRYAISFLGQGNYTDALPALEKIVLDDTELYYLKTDALEAIYHISPPHAAKLAAVLKFKVHPDDKYGHVARSVAGVEAGTHKYSC